MADSIFFNGDIVTMIKSQTDAEAIAVKNGKISKIGSLSEIMQLRDPETDLVDLNGSTLLPGLIEPHTHPILSALDGFCFTNMGAFQPGATAEKSWESLKKTIELTPKGQWIHVNGMNPMLIEGLVAPTRTFLDGLSTEHPITILAVHVHTLYCNSFVFDLAQVNEKTPAPPGGEYTKGADGLLNGQVHESAISTIIKHRPSIPKEQGERCLIDQTRSYASFGYTTIAATGLFPQCDGAFEAVTEVFEKKTCPVRLVIYYRNTEASEHASGKSGSVENGLTVVGVKFWADGSPYAGTMATAEPYLDTKLTREALKFAPYPNCGALNYEFEALFKEMLPYHMKGLQIATHAHGERAIDMALVVYSKLLSQHPRDDHRYRLEHCGLITREQLKQCKQLGVTVSFYPDHIYYYGRNLRDEILGEERAARFMPIKIATEVGVPWTLHSDTPCCPLGPFRVLKTVTTRSMRRLPGESSHQTLGEDQVVDIDLALKGYTTNAAWQTFQEDFIGSLNVGKLADFTVVTLNPRKVDPIKLDEIQVLSTYKSGIKTSHN